MTDGLILQPGEHWEGTVVVENPVFATRATRTVLTKAERLFSAAIYAAEQAQRQGYSIGADTLNMVNPELSVALLTDLLGSSKFQNALEARGIALTSRTGLTPQQLGALSLYLDNTTPATHAQKLKIIGVSNTQWQGWLRQPRFAARYSELAEEALRDVTPIALQRLAQHVDNGNLNAITLALEINGRHDRRKDTVDVNQVLAEIFAVLDEEVSAEVLGRIAAKVKSRLGTGSTPQVLQIRPPELAADSVSPIIL